MTEDTHRQSTSDSIAGRGKTRSKPLVILELAVTYAMILIVCWTPRPWQRYLWWVAAASIVIFTCISFDGLKAMGLGRANSLRSLWIVPVALAVSTAAVVAAIRLGTLHVPEGPVLFLKTYWAYALWAAVQQFLLQCFFLSRLLRLLHSAKFAAIAAAIIFSLAHLPSPILVPVTLLWGLAACLLFLRYRNLYPLAIAHAILGITIAITIPGPVDHNMRVGLGYLKYRPRTHPIQIQLPKP
jgi:membrane protease YdiL (CAAX protease family)